jgi:hypothetical protein
MKVLERKLVFKDIITKERNNWKKEMFTSKEA